MTKTLSLSVILIVVSFFICEASDLSLTLEVEPNPVITGLPVIVTMRMISDKEFTLDGDFNDCDSHTKLSVTDTSGNIVDYEKEMSCPSGQRSPFDSQHKTSYKRIAEYTKEIFLLPGEYNVSAQYNSYGPYLDRYSQTDQRPVEGIWVGELASNQVKLTVKNPEGEDQKAFLTLRPLQEELPKPENQLPWFFRVEGEQILKDYPKSNYAAWILWKNGEMSYRNVLGRSMSIAEEFAYKDELAEIESTLDAYPCASRRELLGVIEPWEKLSNDFPTFFYNRPQILKGLSQAFIRIGNNQKSIPLIKELLEKYPGTDEAKKVADYKAWMQQKNIWN